MPKRPITPAYLFFYLLFWPDTWRIVIGLAAAALLTPRIKPPDQPLAAVMLFIMLVTIGYAVSAVPGRKIGAMFRNLILKDRRP